MKTKIYITTILIMAAVSLTAQVVEFKQFFTPPDSLANNYGNALSYDGAKFVVGNQSNPTDANGNNKMDNTGAAYIYFYSGNQWNLGEKLVSSDRNLGDRFGSSVDIDGDELIVGANFAYDISSNPQIVETGVVYYFKYESGKWIEKQKMMSSDRQAGDGFGAEVSMYNNELFISSTGQDYDDQGQNYIKLSGAVYYYTMESGLWVEKQKIVAYDRTNIDEFFGHSIVFNGSQLIIGSVNSGGSLYVFEKNGNGNWVFKQKLQASDGSEIGFNEISLYGDILVAGSISDSDENGAGTILKNAGAVYVFKRNSLNIWVEIQKIVSPHRQLGGKFGESVSISANLIAIGAIRDQTDENNSNPLVAEGATYLYKKDQNNKWTFFKKMVGENRYGTSSYGTKVAVNDYSLIVTSKNDKAGTSNRPGSAHYYSISGINIGLTEVKLGLFTDIYPNPTHDVINIESSPNIERIQIYNVNGKLVIENNLEAREQFYSVDVSGLNPAVYLIQIYTDQGIVADKILKIE